MTETKLTKSIVAETKLIESIVTEVKVVEAIVTEAKVVEVKVERIFLLNYYGAEANASEVKVLLDRVPV